MESGLEDRNNTGIAYPKAIPEVVSMESGLEDRNNTHNVSHADSGHESQWSPA